MKRGSLVAMAAMAALLMTLVTGARVGAAPKTPPKTAPKPAPRATPTAQPAAPPSSAYKIMFDGQPAVFEAPPVEHAGVICVPMKGVFARLGAVVNYDNITHTVKAVRGKTLVLLTLGSDTATVNLKPHKLQVPPFMLGEAIMVPLRFVGESMGAAVSYDEQTHVVAIKSGKEATITLPTMRIPPSPTPTPDPNATPTPAPDVQITQLSHSGTAPLHPGDVLRVTMVGSPKGQAYFSIPGVTDKTPLKEEPEGTYTADFTLPATASVKGAALYGVLQVGERRAPLATAPLPLTVQPLVPHLGRPAPEPGASVTERTPRITAFFEMIGGTLDLASVRVTVNGADVTKQAYVTREFFTYTPPQPLFGAVKVQVAGKVTPRGAMAPADWADEWSFSIPQGGSAARIQSASHGPTTAYKAGDVVEVTMIGTAGGTARFDIGVAKKGIEMREASPGTYIGSYRVQAGDGAQAATIVVRLKAGGEEATAQAPIPITLGTGTAAATDMPLTVSSPLPDAPVSAGLTVKGQTLPGAAVRVDVMSHVPVVERDVRVAGAETKADGQGIYTVDVKLPWPVKNVKLTVVVTASDASGKRAGPVVVPVNRK